MAREAYAWPPGGKPTRTSSARWRRADTTAARFEQAGVARALGWPLAAYESHALALERGLSGKAAEVAREFVARLRAEVARVEIVAPAGSVAFVNGEKLSAQLPHDSVAFQCPSWGPVLACEEDGAHAGGRFLHAGSSLATRGRRTALRCSEDAAGRSLELCMTFNPSDVLAEAWVRSTRQAAIGGGEFPLRRRHTQARRYGARGAG